MGWALRGATVGWCCAILISTAGMERVGSTGALPVPPERPPASVTQPDWQPPVRMEGARRASTTTVPGATHRRGDALEVAEPLLQAYRTAAQLVSSGCHLPVSLLAAIGQVESGNLRGRSLDVWHRAVPAVLGPVLDGDPFGRVPDTDGGVLDGNRKWDRAVGPMQFLPSTWIAYAVDLDGDGRLDPQDVEDAAGSAAVYLCQSGGDLAEPASLRKAVLTYNHSRAYLRLVLAWMAAYDEAGLTAGSGLAALPAVLLRAGVAAAAPVGKAARQATRKHGAKATGSGPGKIGAVPTASAPGSDPVRPGATWPGSSPVPPGEELPPCVAEPPVTEPPVTDPPVTDPPASESPPTEPPVTEPTATDPPATEPTPEPAPAPTGPTQVPALEPSESPTCEPATPNDPTTPVATETDPADPGETPQEPCGTCAP